MTRRRIAGKPNSCEGKKISRLTSENNGLHYKWVPDEGAYFTEKIAKKCRRTTSLNQLLKHQYQH